VELGREFVRRAGHHNFNSFAPPNPVANWELKAVQIAAGRNHSCVVTKDGQIACLGEGVAGQLGIGPLQRRSVWRNVAKLTREPGAIAIGLAAGGDSTAAIVGVGRAEPRVDGDGD
jgi:alpha-tubulin suppressor-like RCC1 family protein